MERKKALTVIPVLAVWFAFISSCVTIDEVSQPETGLLGKPFESVVQNTTEEGESTAIPVFAVNLPHSWEVVACKALFNDTTVYSCDEPDPVHSALINDDYYPGNWHSRRMPIQGLVVGDTMQVTWTIRPTTPGEHKLDYWTSVYYENQPEVWTYEVEIDPQTDPIPFNHKITIAANIPAISGFSAFIFSAMLLLTGIVYLVFMKKRSGNSTPSSLLVAFLVLTMICLLHEGGAAYADEKPTLSGAAIRNFKNQVAEDPGLREALAQNPRETIEQNFDLAEEQQALLDQLSDEDLTSVAEVFIAAEKVDDIKCMFLNKKQPRLTCIISGGGAE